MTKMLASVVTPEEADVAIAGEADIIDLKDPSRGALGALPIDTVREITAHVGGRKPVSAVTGDLPMRPEALVSAAAAMAETGVDFVKVGLFPDARRAECVRALGMVARMTKLIGVMFADREPDLELLPAMKEAGFAGAMIDTAGKGAGRLLDFLTPAQTAAFVAACREHGLLCGLAGSLEAPDVPRLLAHRPDYLGFRGALCKAQDRKRGLDAAAFESIRDLIPPEEEFAPPDYAILSARGYWRDDAVADVPDRLHVRDLVLPVEIGAYASEHDKTQRVRFNVTAEVRRKAHLPEDLRHVFSYDLIIDAIKALVEGGHIVLVETLAERIAQRLLQHADVLSITVRVEKLDLGPGAVGVEITRRRAAEAAQVHRLVAAGLDPSP